MQCAADYIISSYIPSTRAVLRNESSASIPPEQQFKMTVVVDTDNLPLTSIELQQIKAYVSNDCITQLGIPGSPATIETVAFHFSTSSIVHFACNGKHDLLNPLNNTIFLQDDQHLSILEIIKQKKIPQGSLAFLCACNTAMGDEKLPDQAMSIGASLIFAGYSSVVTTMW